MIVLDPEDITVLGFSCRHDRRLGLLSVAHDGSIGWEELQAIKDAVWGAECRAIEVYPRRSALVNTGNWRHLWRLGEADFCPDLLGDGNGDIGCANRLEARFARAWAKAEAVFR